jgi:hypothetical protein
MSGRSNGVNTVFLGIKNSIRGQSAVWAAGSAAAAFFDRLLECRAGLSGGRFPAGCDVSAGVEGTIQSQAKTVLVFDHNPPLGSILVEPLIESDQGVLHPHSPVELHALSVDKNRDVLFHLHFENHAFFDPGTNRGVLLQIRSHNIS